MPEGIAEVTVTGGGNPIEGVPVYAYKDNGAFVNLVDTTDASGTTSFRLPEQSYCAYKELRRAVLSQVNFKMEAEGRGQRYAGEYDGDGLILLLGELGDEEAQDVLLSLLDVYLGSSSGEALTYVILKQGKTVQSKLRKVKEKHVGYMFRDEWKSIQEEFPNLRYMKVPDRNRNIDRLLDLIESGVVIKYEL